MKLKHLKWLACPVCTSKLIVERQQRPTQGKVCCNGEWFEMQEFECGCVIEYSPNFGREKVRTQCPDHPSEKKRQSKQDEESGTRSKKITADEWIDKYKGVW